MLSTDILSEGQNLQQAQAVLSFEMPWNPQRVVQRNGRIIRLRSPHDTAYLYTLPPQTGRPGTTPEVGVQAAGEDHGGKRLDGYGNPGIGRHGDGVAGVRRLEHICGTPSPAGTPPCWTSRRATGRAARRSRVNSFALSFAAPRRKAKSADFRVCLGESAPLSCRSRQHWRSLQYSLPAEHAEMSATGAWCPSQKKSCTGKTYPCSGL